MLTKDNKILAVKELKWGDVVNNLASVSPDLAAVMKKLDVNKAAYTFYLASYPFGSKIINEKKAYLPLENGDSIAFDDDRLPDLLRNNLSYNSDIDDPMGIILSKNSEFYLPGEGRIQPHSIIRPGQLFGIPRAIDNGPSTSSVLESNLNAGSRSVFMLSKISDQVHHGKLQEKFGIKSPPPLIPQDHWAVFVELSSQANSSWRSDVIYFPRNWISSITSEELHRTHKSEQI